MLIQVLFCGKAQFEDEINFNGRDPALLWCIDYWIYFRAYFQKHDGPDERKKALLITYMFISGSDGMRM